VKEVASAGEDGIYRGISVFIDLATEVAGSEEESGERPSKLVAKR